MRAALLLLVTACGRLPPSPPPEFPTLEPGETYHTRIADLRTTLGRAGIPLRVAGMHDSFETEACVSGVSVFGHSSCVRCDLAGERTPIDGAVIEATTRSFRRYPTEVLVASKIEYVAVCRNITHVVDDEVDTPAGVADLRGGGLLISVRYFLDRGYAENGTFTVDDITHHELWHLLERAHMTDEITSDPEWNLHNPIGFAYDRKAHPGTRREGFVNTYAMTSAIEDRASVYEMMLAHPDELCEMARADELIRIKSRIIWRRALRALGTDRFIREAAPCIDWLDT